MNSKFSYYIVAFFVIANAYFFYLILAFYFNQFQTDHTIATITNKNQELSIRNKRKENTEKYIHTNAYVSQVAKAMQNKKLPGEEMINIITQEDVDGNANISSQEVFANSQKKQEDPTLKMSNFERWQYLFKK